MATIATLIVDIAANTSTLTKGVEEVQKSLDKAGGFASKLGGVLAGAFSIGAVTSAVNKFLDMSGALTDMAAKTGISTTELQKLKYAAEQNGGTLDGVTKAIGKMGKALVEGNSGTVGAMKALGLSIDVVRNMDPATAFATIGDAIAKVPNPLERSKLAMDLFGKSGAELLPMMTGNLSETMKAAEKLGIVMDEKTVAAGDNLGDTLGALSSVGQAILGRMLAPMLPALQMLANGLVSAGGVVDYLGLMFDALHRAGLIAIKMLIDGAIKVGEFAAKVPGLSRVLGDDAAAMAGLKEASQTLGIAIKQVESGTDGAVVAVKKFIPPVVGLTDEQQAAAKAAAAHAKAIRGITDELTGQGAIKAAKDMLAALKPIPDIHKLTAEAQEKVHKTMTAALDVYRASGREAPEAMRMLWVETMKLPPVVSGVGAAFRDLGQKIDIVIPKTEEFGLKFKVIEGISLKAGYTIGQSIDVVPPKVRKATDSLGQMAASLTQLSQIGGSAFGPLMQGISALIVNMSAAKKQNEEWGGSAGIASALFDDEATASEKWASAIASGATIANGAMAAWSAGAKAASTSAALFHGALSGAQAGAAFGPWGAAIGAAGGALLGFIAHLNAGRKEVEKFAATFDTAAAGSGFDEMHAKLLTLGGAGEQLWIKLTQGVGRNNPEQAKKVIEEINAALAGQDAWMQRLPGLIEKYGLSWEQAGQQAKQAHLDEIARGLIQDFADLSKAGFDVTTITGGMTTAVNDYIAQAIRTGTEIPAAMQPLLQKMIDMGVLTDENGLKLDTLEGLTFATTLTAGFASVVDAIRELTRALSGDLGGALDGLARRRITIPIDFDPGELPDGGATGTRASNSVTSGLSLASRGGGSSVADSADRLSAERQFLLVEVPKAITAAVQKAVA